MQSDEMKNIAIGMERYRSIQAIAEAGLGNSPLCDLFRYAKIKGNTLFFVFKADAAKFEFKHQKERILERMRTYYKLHKERLMKANALFKEIAAVVIAEHKVEEIKKESLVYGERSSGEFTIACTDPKLRMLFESIQQTIKNKPPQKLS